MIHFLFEGGNSDLKGRYFPLGKGIRKHLEQTLASYDGDRSVIGYKRLNNILSMANGIAYNEMKRIKNFFDNYAGSDKSVDYILNGGTPMKLWVDNTLNTATSAIEGFKQAKKEAGAENAFRKTHSKDRQTKVQKPKVAKVQTANVVKGVHNNSAVKYESKKRCNVIRITEEQMDSLIEGTAFRTYGLGNYDVKNFQPIKNVPIRNKPDGGLWASPSNENGSAWVTWNKKEADKTFGGDDYFEFELADNARVLKLEKLSDVKKVPMMWDNPDIMRLPLSRHLITYKMAFYDSKGTCDWMPDFEKIAQTYEAIEYVCNNEMYNALLGWDVDSLLVLNPNVIRVIRENPNERTSEVHSTWSEVLARIQQRNS